MLDLHDVRWELGEFGKLNVRHGKGSRRGGPEPRLVPLINGANDVLTWFVRDVWGHFVLDHTVPGAPLFPSERRTGSVASRRATADVFRRSLAEATAAHLPSWSGTLTPHVLRHCCASQLYDSGWTCSRSRSCSGMPGPPRPCATSMSTAAGSSRPGSRARPRPPTDGRGCDHAS